MAKTRWIDQLGTETSPTRTLRLLQSTPPDVLGAGDWLDADARRLLRVGAMRLLQAVAGEDLEGEAFSPRRSKDAIQALSMLFDRVPDVLSFEARSTGEEIGGEIIIDLYGESGGSEIQRALETLERCRDE